MKKLFNRLKTALGLIRKPCTIMQHLQIKTFAVKYSQAVVMGIEREERVKYWQVAASTVNPPVSTFSHSEWMIYIQLKRAQLVSQIAELEHQEITSQVNAFSRDMKLSPKFLTNLNS